MVGYDVQNTYRLWNNLKCIKIGRDVIFDEQDMFKTQNSNNENNSLYSSSSTRR